MTDKCNCVKCASLSGSFSVPISYDTPENSRPCPKNFKSANGGKVCILEHDKATPLIDSLSSTEFPTTPQQTIKRKSRLDREKSLTELLYGGSM